MWLDRFIGMYTVVVLQAWEKRTWALGFKMCPSVFLFQYVSKERSSRTMKHLAHTNLGCWVSCNSTRVSWCTVKNVSLIKKKKKYICFWQNLGFEANTSNPRIARANSWCSWTTSTFYFFFWQIWQKENKLPSAWLNTLSKENTQQIVWSQTSSQKTRLTSQFIMPSLFLQRQV